jgi:hypothetical protein
MPVRLPHHRRFGEMMRAAWRWSNRFGDAHLGSEHILLALAEIGGPTTDVLAEMGVELEDLRDTVLGTMPESRRTLVGPTDEEVLDDVGVDLAVVRQALVDGFGLDQLQLGRGLMLNPALTVVLCLAEDHAERLGHTEVCPEHVLLALVWAGSFGGSLLGRSVSGPELRRRLAARMEVEVETRARYLEDCERSERVASARVAASRTSLRVTWWDLSAVEDRTPSLLEGGGAAAIDGLDAFDRFAAIASAAGFTIVDDAHPEAKTFWVEVNPKLRQVFFALVGKDSTGKPAGVGITNPTIVPGWVDVRSWPTLPDR